MFLGVDVIKSLVLSHGIISQYDDQVVRSFRLDKVWSRGCLAGPLAREIALDQGSNKTQADYAMMAAMVCDIGTLALATGVPDSLQCVHQRSLAQGQPDWTVERELLGYSHMEVGAYLLALWDLPNPIVEAVAFHHCPMECTPGSFEPITAVHVALALVEASRTGSPLEVDLDYLDARGLTERIPRWQDMQQDRSAPVQR